MNETQVLAVWGSPGAGKTTLAVKIAKELERMHRPVVLVLCDDEVPAVPLLLPNGKQPRLSLGELLSQTRVSQTAILKYSIPYGNDNIVLLGYCADENEKTYVEYSEFTAKSFLVALARLEQTIIVDCSSHLDSNLLSVVAMEAADATLRVVNATSRSATYIRSHQLLLNDENRFHYSKQLVLLNNVMPGQDDIGFSNTLGKASYILPHCSSVAEQFEAGKLTESLFGREAKQFEPVVKAIAKDVFFS